jgi:uncharacterized protein YcbX
MGRVVAIWRYPVKSMMGEELNAADVGARGLVGDRAYALVDAETGKVASAKNPKAWPGLFDFRASYPEPPYESETVPPAAITRPDGSRLATDSPDASRLLSEAVGRPVRLASSSPEGAQIEGYWPDYDFLEARDAVFKHTLPPGTFFDLGLVHLVTTSTLGRLHAHSPGSRFEARRFRPNLVIEPDDGAEGFVEDGWIDRTLAIGDEVRLRVTDPTPRCVMTTLAQGDLPKDPGVLRAAVKENWGNVGVYATVVRGGRIRRGDAIRLE